MASLTKRRLETSEPGVKTQKVPKTRNIFLEAWEELKAEEIKRIQDTEAAWPAVEQMVECLTFEHIRAAKLVLGPSQIDTVRKLGFCASELADRLEAHKEQKQPDQPRTVFSFNEISQQAKRILDRAYPEFAENSCWPSPHALQLVQDPEWQSILRTLSKQEEQVRAMLRASK